MNIGEWRAQLVSNPGFNGAFLYLSRRLSHGSCEFLVKDGTIRTVSEGDAVSADSSFALLEHEQIQAMAEAFNNFGIKTVNDHRAAGLLEAKDAHLQDMRNLVFKGRK